MTANALAATETDKKKTHTRHTQGAYDVVHIYWQRPTFAVLIVHNPLFP